MPATGRDVVVLPPKKGGTAGLAGNINYETGEVHMPWKQHITKVTVAQAIEKQKNGFI